MDKVITQLKSIVARSENIDAASQALSKEFPRFSKSAARNVMLDVQDFLQEKIDETQFCLFLKQHGF